VKPSEDFTTIEMMADVIDSIDAKTPQPRSPSACTRYGSACWAIGICSGEVAESEFKRKESENEEL